MPEVSLRVLTVHPDQVSPCAFGGGGRRCGEISAVPVVSRHAPPPRCCADDDLDGHAPTAQCHDDVLAGASGSAGEDVDQAGLCEVNGGVSLDYVCCFPNSSIQNSRIRFRECGHSSRLSSHARARASPTDSSAARPVCARLPHLLLAQPASVGARAMSFAAVIAAACDDLVSLHDARKSVACGQGPTARRRTKGGVFGPGRRFASCLRGGGTGKITAGRPGSRFLSSHPDGDQDQVPGGLCGGAVTPSIHPEVPVSNLCRLDWVSCNRCQVGDLGAKRVIPELVCHLPILNTFGWNGGSGGHTGPPGSIQGTTVFVHIRMDVEQ